VTCDEVKKFLAGGGIVDFNRFYIYIMQLKCRLANTLTIGLPEEPEVENRSSTAPATNTIKHSAPTTIVEANGWVKSDNGEVTLVATAPTANIDIPGCLNLAVCAPNFVLNYDVRVVAESSAESTSGLRVTSAPYAIATGSNRLEKLSLKPVASMSLTLVDRLLLLVQVPL
jgi:hypothetical protein